MADQANTCCRSRALLVLAAGILSCPSRQQSGYGRSATGAHLGSLRCASQRQAERCNPIEARTCRTIRQSIRPAHLVCLDRGKHLSMLKRGLRTDHQRSTDDYRRRWDLPASYPMVAPAYAKVRSKKLKLVLAGAVGLP